ncbi:hypothetical protein SAMN05216551_106167 [Chitinasiproducens palmae]|uniref:Uncharacterized protein n=2 Tax=Chitinasiproducens palmae TaxID=1770053 RepID=A0A1H2PR43_9BURK|nr:hypothetical protein SAMN05216551_106167 [Chitinasiproducens palmae]
MMAAFPPGSLAASGFRFPVSGFPFPASRFSAARDPLPARMAYYGWSQIDDGGTASPAPFHAPSGRLQAAARQSLPYPTLAAGRASPARNEPPPCTVMPIPDYQSLMLPVLRTLRMAKSIACGMSSNASQLSSA